MKKFLPTSLSLRLSKRLKTSSGFTIIELMVVMTVISILAAMVLYGLNKAQASARDAGRQQIMNGIQIALERYYGDNQKYPAGASMCNAGGAIPTLTAGTYLSAAPNDPSTKTSICAGGLPSGTAYYYEAAGLVHNSVPSPCSGIFPTNAYQLVLTKESGGVNYFCSPQ